MKKLFLVAALCAGFIGSAQAHVSLHIGVSIPTFPVIPAYSAYPTYAPPAMVYAAPPPPPVYVQPAVVYAPPVTYAPPPVMYAPPVIVRSYYGHRHGNQHWHRY